MKSIILSLLFVLFQNVTFAQEGVNFEPLTFTAALAKAKAENKLILMDCYTSWCSPCKYMTNEVFIRKEAGDYFNPHFISIKFDMEKGEGKELAKRFPVKGYPTFFIIRPDGTVQHTVVGGGNLEGFITRVERGLNNKTSFYYLDTRYKKGKISKKETMAYLTALDDANQYDTSKKVREELEARLTDKDKLQPDFWPLIERKDYKTTDFQFVLANLPALRKNVGTGKVDLYLYTKLTIIINQCKSGRSTEAREILKKVRQELSAIELTRKEELTSNLEYAEACAEENIDQVIRIAEKTAFPVEKEKIWTVVSPFSDWIKAKATKEQLTRIATLGDSILANTADEKLKPQLGFFFESFKIASHKGVYFQDLTFEEALQKAKTLHKMVLIDCYTGWCGPCMYMANVVFKEESIGDYLNSKFICVKYDLESGKGPEIQKKFNVRAYPTFIILNPDGSLYHQFVGGGDSEKFIQKIENALKEENALGMQKMKYDKGERDKTFLTAYLNNLTGSYSPEALIVANDLFSILTEEEKLSPDYWFITGDINIGPRGSEIEKFVLKNRMVLSRSIGKEKVDDRLLNGYMREVMMVLGSQYTTDEKTFDEISRQVKALNLKKNPVYQAYIKIARAKNSGNIDRLITVCEQVFTTDLNKQIIYNMRIDMETQAQRERWNKFITKISNMKNQ